MKLRGLERTSRGPRAHCRNEGVDGLWSSRSTTRPSRRTLWALTPAGPLPEPCCGLSQRRDEVPGRRAPDDSLDRALSSRTETRGRSSQRVRARSAGTARGSSRKARRRGGGRGAGLEAEGAGGAGVWPARNGPAAPGRLRPAHGSSCTPPDEICSSTSETNLLETTEYLSHCFLAQKSDVCTEKYRQLHTSWCCNA